MKKRNLLFVAITAVVLLSALTFGCVYAFGTNATENTSNNVNVIVTTTEPAVAAGETFDVKVSVANDDITDYKVAGVQVKLPYPANKISNAVLTNNVGDHSTVEYSATNGNIVFVCVKNEFDDDAGYTTELKDLFTVTFTASEKISDTSALFDNFELLVGTTTAAELEEVKSTYAGNIPEIAKAILNDEIKVESVEVIGSVVVIPTLSNKAGSTVEEIQASVEGATVTTKDGSDKVGTGSTITVNGKTATIVVKGDVDGNGIVDLFDAMLINKAYESNDDADKFADDEAEKHAANLNKDNTIDDKDVSSVFDSILGK